MLLPTGPLAAAAGRGGIYHWACRDEDTVDFDLLRYRYEVDGVPVTIVECAGGLYVEVATEAIPSHASPPTDRLEAVATFLLSPAAGPFRFVPSAADEARRSWGGLHRQSSDGPLIGRERMSYRPRASRRRNER